MCHVVVAGRAGKTAQYSICHVERLPDKTAQTANDATPHQPTALEYIARYRDAHTHQQKDGAEGLDDKSGIDLNRLRARHKQIIEVSKNEERQREDGESDPRLADHRADDARWGRGLSALQIVGNAYNDERQRKVKQIEDRIAGDASAEANQNGHPHRAET